jgi:hypothetical protein
VTADRARLSDAPTMAAALRQAFADDPAGVDRCATEGCDEQPVARTDRCRECLTGDAAVVVELDEP